MAALPDPEDLSCHGCGATPGQEHTSDCPVYLTNLRQPDEGPAPNVIVALTRVMRDLPGIGKGMNAAPDQGGYAYRGIEQITGHAQTLFARHGIVMVPRVTRWDRSEVLVGKDRKIWHDELVEVVYKVYGPGGMDDWIEVGPLKTIGRDGTDKGVNKCMTQALKYALIQVLCIGDKKDDNDGTTDEAQADRNAPVVTIDAIQAEGLRARLVRVGNLTKAYPQEWVQRGFPVLADLAEMPAAWLDGAVAILDAAEAAIELSGDALPPFAGGPGDVGDGEVPRDVDGSGEASTDAPEMVADGESPAPPVLDVAQMADAEITARIALARVGKDKALLDALVGEAIERGLDVAAPVPAPEASEEPAEPGV
jgi:hypothetical protein